MLLLKQGLRLYGVGYAGVVTYEVMGTTYRLAQENRDRPRTIYDSSGPRTIPKYDFVDVTMYVGGAFLRGLFTGALWPVTVPIKMYDVSSTKQNKKLTIQKLIILHFFFIFLLNHAST